MKNRNTFENKIEQCPYCHAKMIKGYIQGGRGIFWCKTPKKIPTLPPISKEAILLTGEIMGTDAIEAYKCESCKKIILSYKR